MNKRLLWYRILLDFFESYSFWSFELWVTHLFVMCLKGIIVSVVQSSVSWSIQLFITRLCCFPSRIRLWHCINNFLQDIIWISWSFAFFRIFFQPIVDRNPDKCLINIVRFSIKKVSCVRLRLFFLLNKCLICYINLLLELLSLKFVLVS